MMKSHNIILVGAGQIGSRHLQGLLRSDLSLTIGVVEPSAANKKIAEERVVQAGGTRNGTRILYWETVNKISFAEAEIAIIATNSDIRPVIIGQLLNKVKIKNLILEKVVFQSINIFEQQLSTLALHGINAWVNCPRRMYPFYKGLKSRLSADASVNITVSGSNWGLGCNSLHFIDLFAFLSSDAVYFSDFTALDYEILQSKREGFVEFTGRIGFSNKRGQLMLTSLASPDIPMLIEIIIPGERILISEIMGKIITMRKEEGFAPIISEEHFPFQSELTHLFVNEIINTGSCGLVKLDESFSHHSVLLPLLTEHLNAIQGTYTDTCPIT